MKKINLYKALYLVLLFFVFSLSQGFAQSDSRSINSSGSFYSLYGVGFPTENNTARELSLGISGVSLDNTQSNTLSNPALWGKNTYATTSSGFNLSQYNATDNNSESLNSDISARYLQLTLPIFRQKFGISASLYPVTSSNYRSFDSGTIVNSENESIEYVSDMSGSGGINKFELGFGWNINKNIAVGYAPSLAFISQENTTELFFDQNDYPYNYVDSKVTGSTFSHRFGALLSFENILNDDDRISIGSSFILPVEISTKQSTETSRMINNQQQNVALGQPLSGNAKLPAELNAGLTYYPSNFVNISMEGKFQQWSDAQSDLNTNDASLELTDRVKLGLGGEYHPYRTNSMSFLSNFRYSGGVSYDSGHLKAQDQEINTLWFSAGLGIISRFNNSSVDLSVQHGLRGTTSNDLIREKIWSFNLSVNLTELMFFRPKLN
ncbi:MAG: hypothetical protein WD357_01355 [Gracilimonas sp.]